MPKKVHWVERHPVLSGVIGAVIGAVLASITTVVITARSAAPRPADIRLLRPEKMEEVNRSSRIAGIAMNIPDGSHLWLATRNTTSQNYYYTKPSIVDIGVFAGKVCLGATDNPVDAYYEMIAILLSDQADNALMAEKKSKPDYNTVQIYPNATRLGVTTVKRLASKIPQDC